MAKVEQNLDQDFWLFHNLDEIELEETRKLMNPELDLSNLGDIEELFDKLNHLLD